MSEHPAPRNHIEDSRMILQGLGVSYDKAMEGQGRWCVLETPLGVPVGTMWTDDRGGLGFVPVPLNENERAPWFASGFSAATDLAAILGTPAGDVFDAWADRATQNLAAREIQSGDLAALYRKIV